MPQTISTDKELNDYIKGYQLIKSYKFLGVFANDTKPKLTSGQCLIFNSDDSNSQGTHWLALINSEHRNIIYDSFGSISPFKFKYHSSNRNQEQAIYESNCGYRCIAFLVCCDLFGASRVEKVI